MSLEPDKSKDMEMEYKETAMQEHDTLQNITETREEQRKTEKFIMENEAIQDMMEATILQMRIPSSWLGHIRPRDVSNEYEEQIEEYVVDYLNGRNEGSSGEYKRNKAAAMIGFTFLKYALLRMNQCNISNPKDLFAIISDNDNDNDNQ